MGELAAGLLITLIGVLMLQYRHPLNRLRRRIFEKDLFVGIHGTDIAALFIGFLLIFSGIVLVLLEIDDLFGS